MKDRAIFVISLDFELHWGIRDLMPVEDCRARLLGARSAIPRLLDLFSAYAVHATWATVGLLFFDAAAEVWSSVPAIRPRYSDPALDPYPSIETLGAGETDDPYHYAPSLIRAIRRTPNQEVGTHTFSHYHCMEPGQDGVAFREDLRAAVNAAARHGIALRSCVFPRNQVNRAYLPVIREFGIVAYRDNPRGWLHSPRPFSEERAVRRALRLCDSYIGLAGRNSYLLADFGGAPPFGIRSSRYLRPWSRIAGPAERLRSRIIRSEMTAAARTGRLFHLWMHPEDMGMNPEENLAFMKGILEHYLQLNQRYGMTSMNMSEVADALVAEGGSSGAAPVAASHGS